MRQGKAWQKDHYGAVLLIALGTTVLLMGRTYRMGDLNRMGAGFIPVVLGALLVLVGIAIGVTASPANVGVAVQTGHGAGATGPEWRGWSCIVGGVVAFVILGRFGGLMPATFAAVFIAAMGDRNNTVKTAGALALIMVVFCAAIFHYGLKLPLPLFQWG